MRRERLPRIGWIVATVLMVIFGGTSFVRRIRGTEPYLGVEWIGRGRVPVAVVVDPGSPADRAGILPGDRLESVNGEPVESALDATVRPWDLDRRSRATLELVRGTQRLTVELEPWQRPSAPPLYGYLAVVGVAFLASGVFLVLRWPATRGGASYAMLASSLFLLTTLSHTGAAGALDWAVYWGDTVAGAWAPAFLLQLSLVMARRSTATRRVGTLVLHSVAGALLLASLWLVAFGGAARLDSPAAALELLDRAQLAFLAASACLSVALLGRAYRRSVVDLQRTQLRWMLWGLGLGLGPFVLGYAVPWAMGLQLPAIAEFAALPLLVVPCAFAAALSRYRLHDLDMLLRRGLVEVAAALFTLGVYAAAVAALRRLADGILPISESGLRYPAILIAAASYPKLRSMVRTAVEKLSFRSRYSYRATLLDWARELNAETDLSQLVPRLEERVRETLGVPDARVLVRMGDGPEFAPAVGNPGDGPDRLLTVLDAAVLAAIGRDRRVSCEEGVGAFRWARHLFGMKVRGRVTAVLAVAERPSGQEPLSTEDQSLLATLTAHAASAIEGARLVGEVRNRADQVEKLKASQERILEGTGVGLLLMGEDGTILAWNRRLEEIYGLNRQEAIGRTVGDVFPLHFVRRIRRETAATGGDQDTRIDRYQLVNRAGTRIVVNLTLSPPGPTPDGGVARVVSFDDVTEQVKLEEQILQNERLASLGLLAAGVAHEVNTPLTGISSYTQMLLEAMDPDDPRRDLLVKIEDQSRRASSIANSLLNLARPEGSSFESLPLNEIVAESLRLFEPQVRGRGIRLETELAEGLPPVRAHRGKLQQVLLNLLLNARDALESGGRIRVATSARGDRVTLEVLDDGTGIAEEDLPRIFDPFFTTKGRGKGTGLGLSISHGIVREHHGELVVESVPGAFTCFRVELPRAAAFKALA